MTALRIVATADWHGALPADLPEGDVLVIAGDLLPASNHERHYQSAWTRDRLIPHLASLPFEHIIFVAGNHDFLFAESKQFVKLLPDNVDYLEDESTTLAGVRFHGSPWSPRFGKWAFMLDELDLIPKWALIPDDTDVLIVHGPPHGATDLTALFGSVNAGSKTLRERIEALDIPLVITGHIHEGYGSDRIGNSAIENVSLVDMHYNPINPARTFTVPGLRAAGGAA